MPPSRPSLLLPSLREAVSPAVVFMVWELPDVWIRPAFACTFHSTAGACGFASSALPNAKAGSFCAAAGRARRSAAVASQAPRNGARARAVDRGANDIGGPPCFQQSFRRGGKVLHNGTANQHRWSFFRAGDFDQVKLRSGDDLMNLESLDQKLWVALACPTSGLEIDAQTLSLIDTDQDGRVRAGELT